MLATWVKTLYIAAVCVKWKKEGLIFATPSSPVRSAQISSLKTSHSNNIMYQINPLNIYQKTNSITSENKWSWQCLNSVIENEFQKNSEMTKSFIKGNKINHKDWKRKQTWDNIKQSTLPGCQYQQQYHFSKYIWRISWGFV